MIELHSYQHEKDPLPPDDEEETTEARRQSYDIDNDTENATLLNPSIQNSSYSRASSSNHAATSSPISKGCLYCFLILLLILNLGPAFILYRMNLTLQNEITKLSQRVATLESNNIKEVLDIQGVRTDLYTLTNQTMISDMKTSNKLNILEKLVFKLDNMTSNEEVIAMLNISVSEFQEFVRLDHDDMLEQLQETQEEVNSRLQQTLISINDYVNVLKSNMSQIVNNVEFMSKSADKRTQSLLQESYKNVSAIVNSVQQQIQIEGNNITSQMVSMNNFLTASIHSLNDAVQAAKTEIKDEVQEVHDNMDQYILYSNNQFAAESNFVKYELAGFFSILACLISMWHIHSHLHHFSRPDAQSRIIVILIMVPVYCITSWFSLMFPGANAVLSAIRDVYEAFMIYTFCAFLIAVVAEGKGNQGVEMKLADRIRSDRDNDASETNPKAKAISPPCSCGIKKNDSPEIVAAAIVDQCLMLAMQFVVLKPLLALVPVICMVANVSYEHGPGWNKNSSGIDWESPALYVAIVANISVVFAFYGLVCFYQVMEKELAWCDPWPKFLCVKGIVFMTFYQGLCLQILSSFGFMDQKSATQIQNLLICIEMFMGSIAHFYIYPYYEWKPHYKKHTISIQQALALTGFVSDVRQLSTRRVWNLNSSDIGGRDEVNSVMGTFQIELKCDRSDSGDEKSSQSSDTVVNMSRGKKRGENMTVPLNSFEKGSQSYGSFHDINETTKSTTAALDSEIVSISSLSSANSPSHRGKSVNTTPLDSMMNSTDSSSLIVVNPSRSESPAKTKKSSSSSNHQIGEKEDSDEWSNIGKDRDGDSSNSQNNSRMQYESV